jgi:hypothetical protein
MATNDEGTTDRWRKFLIPGAATVVGAGAGLALTRTDKLRDSLPSLDDVGIGDLVDDLKTKLGSTADTVSSSAGSAGSAGSARDTVSSSELEQHQKRRAEARRQRARR